MNGGAVIDAHHHVWDLSVRDQAWTRAFAPLRRSFSIDDLAPLLSENGVNATVLVQTLNIPDETPELLRVAEQSSFVIGVVGWVDLLADDVDDQLAELESLPGGEFLVGIRHIVQDEEDPNLLRRSGVLRGLQAVANRGLSFDILIRDDQMDAAIGVARALPNVKFILDHFGKPSIAMGEIDDWSEQIVELAKCENVAIKLSGLVTEAKHAAWTVDDLRPYADVVFASFGARRVIFGSDWPVCQLAASYGEVISVARQLTLGLSDLDREWVFGLSACAWYGLEFV